MTQHVRAEAIPMPPPSNPPQPIPPTAPPPIPLQPEPPVDPFVPPVNPPLVVPPPAPTQPPPAASSVAPDRDPKSADDPAPEAPVWLPDTEAEEPDGEVSPPPDIAARPRRKPDSAAMLEAARDRAGPGLSRIEEDARRRSANSKRVDLDRAR